MSNRYLLRTLAVLLVTSFSWCLAPALAHAAEGHDHEEKGKGAAHEEQDGGEEHGDKVKLDPATMKEFSIVSKVAAGGELGSHLTLTGVVRMNRNRVAHIVPRVPGIVREVYKQMGDAVAKGEVLAVLESSDLAETKAIYLAEAERVALAAKKFTREKKLWQTKVGAEQDFLKAKSDLIEAHIRLRSAEQKLLFLGFSTKYLQNLEKQPAASYMRYEIRAPFAGTVIRKHIVLGEAMKADDDVFMIADLTRVWIDLNARQKDLPHLRLGQEVEVSEGEGVPVLKGRISLISPTVTESTRTTLVRVELANPHGAWRPGLFVTARILISQGHAKVIVPKSALQMVENKLVVFVQEGDAYEPRAVRTGRESETQIEIDHGIKPGEVYIAQGSFTFKSELAKESFGGGHSH